MQSQSPITKFSFIGGNLAVDFCNTVAGKRGAIQREYLVSPRDLINWFHQAGIFDGTQAERCLARAGRNPTEAAAMLSRAIELREAIFRVLNSCRAGKRPPNEDFSRINQELSSSLSRLRLIPAIEGECCDPVVSCEYKWRWIVEDDGMDQGLGPIAHAAATLLTQPHGLAHVGMCQGESCGWLFIDTSRNHSRCWCDMRDCGNRAKIRRHRIKERAKDQGAAKAFRSLQPGRELL